MIGTEQTSPFQTMLGNYASIDHFNIGKTPTEAESNQLLNQLNSYNLLIIGINKMGLYPSKRFGISDEQISLIEKLKNRTSVICFFGNPYSLPNFSSFPQTKSLVVAYQDDQDTQELAAQQHAQKTPDNTTAANPLATKSDSIFVQSFPNNCTFATD